MTLQMGCKKSSNGSNSVPPLRVYAHNPYLLDYVDDIRAALPCLDAYTYMHNASSSTPTSRLARDTASPLRRYVGAVTSRRATAATAESTMTQPRRRRGGNSGVDGSADAVSATTTGAAAVNNNNNIITRKCNIVCIDELDVGAELSGVTRYGEGRRLSMPSPAAAPPPPPPGLHGRLPEERRRPSNICRHFLKGTCNRGVCCRFVHPGDKHRVVPGLHASKLSHSTITPLADLAQLAQQQQQQQQCYSNGNYIYIEPHHHYHYNQQQQQQHFDGGGNDGSDKAAYVHKYTDECGATVSDVCGGDSYGYYDGGNSYAYWYDSYATHNDEGMSPMLLLAPTHTTTALSMLVPTSAAAHDDTPSAHTHATREHEQQQQQQQGQDAYVVEVSSPLWVSRASHNSDSNGGGSRTNASFGSCASPYVKHVHGRYPPRMRLSLDMSDCSNSSCSLSAAADASVCCTRNGLEDSDGSSGCYSYRDCADVCNVASRTLAPSA